jgi:uncharacterized protein (TIGR02145 family)
MNNYIVGSFLLVLLMVQMGCSKDQDPVVLNPDAGIDYLNIENDGYQVVLSAVEAPDGQAGTWRIYSGENGRFDDVNDPKTTFYGEPGEKYILGWELSERGEYKASTITVSFKALNPVILSIPQDTIYNNVSFYLEAEAPRFGATGEWTIIDGEQARIENGEQYEAEFIGAEYEVYTLRWTLNYGSKSVYKEITFVTDKLQAYAGDDNLDIISSKTAETKFYTLEGFLPAGATGAWTILKGQSGTVHSENVDNSLFEGVADTVYTLTWTIQLDGVQSVDTVDLRFRGKWGMWTDERDGQSYRFTEVNGLEWMADNYNYAAEPGIQSWYYGQAERSIVKEGYPLETEEDRKKYGRVYSYFAAREYAPEGWRLPTYQEFTDMVTHLGGPLYALDEIVEGGSTGIELNFPGYFEISSSGDPAFRNVFDGQERYGVYWLYEFNEITLYANVFEVSVNSNAPGLYPLPTSYYCTSVRYVRDVEVQ